jgi:TIR domain
MTDQPRARVFISFIHEDTSIADATKLLIEAELGLKDVTIFQSSDQRQVYAGDVWLQKITAALKAAEVILLMLSKRSVRRPWVNFEAGAGWISEGKVVIPCCYGKQLKDALPHPYSALQAVQLDDMSDVEYLLESIHHHLRLPTPAPVTGIHRAMRFAEAERGAKAAGGALDPWHSPDFQYDWLRDAVKDFIDQDDLF